MKPTMKTIKLLVLLFVFPTLLANGQSTLKGSLKGADNQPLRMAHIYLNKQKSDLSHTINVVKADHQGQFELPLPANELLVVTFTGVNHKLVEVPILVGDEKKTIELEVKLGTFDYSDTFDNAAVIGDFNEFKLNTAIPFRKKQEGHYSVKVPANGKGANYQIAGLVKKGLVSIPDSNVQPYVLSKYNSDFYVSEVLSEVPDSVEISFSLSQLPVGGIDASISFSDPVYQQCYHILSQLNQRIPTVVDQHMSAKTKEEKNAFVHDARQELAGLERDIENEDNPMVRSVLYKSYLGIQALRNTYNDSDKRVIGRPKQGIALKILKELPSNSPLWDISMLESLVMILKYDFETYKSYYFEIIDKAEGPTKSWMLMQLGLFCHKNSFPQAYLKCLESLQNEFPDSRALNQLNIRTKKKEVIVGNHIPDFKISNLDGGTITKKSLKGKVYLMDFWATWCGPCVMALPELAHIYDKYKEHGFEILSISMDSDKQRAVDFRKEKHAMPWLNGWATGGMRGALSNTFEMTGIPFILLIDETGQILAKGRSVQEPNLMATLKRQFASNE